MKKQEIELKLKIQNKKEIEEKLLTLGAVLKSKKKQIDILFNSKYFNFGDYDQSLRLRIEKNGTKKATLAFKGTPKHTKEGHKIRDEFETSVSPGQMRKILASIGFEEVAVIEKIRAEYLLGNLEISIDELEFGIFIELEGLPEDIEKIRGQLGLRNCQPIRDGYGRLQMAWRKKKGKK